jgi:N6-L-threonylcarbamoyladenine synthase
MRILGIETSCDETAICVIDADGAFDANFEFKVLGNALISQTAIHAPYGGVFPNLAKREHEKNLVPLLEKALTEAGLNQQGDTLMVGMEKILGREVELESRLAVFLSKHEKPQIDAIAVTYGPGLEPALWVGINFARALSTTWNIPIVPVNHMEGHIVLSAMENNGLAKFTFPVLSLLISGGHTELVLSRDWMHYELIGQTRDDAVGEAFDKVARLLGLSYPGGHEISKLADEARAQHPVSSLSLPRPMIDSNDYDFSFAGLKTAVRKVVDAEELTDEQKKIIALEFENACAEVLVAKSMRAIEEFGANTILVGGGVSANTYIREQLQQTIKDYGLGTKLLIPPPELATDNALMIALAGYFRALKKEFAGSETIWANGNLKLT